MTEKTGCQEKVKQPSAPELSVALLSKMRSSGVSDFVLLKPSFCFAEIQSQSLNFAQYVEILLDTNAENKEAIAKGLLYVRESAEALLASIRRVTLPLESLILNLDRRYEGRNGNDGANLEMEKIDVEAEAEDWETRTRALLGKVGINGVVANNLSKVMANLCQETIRFSEDLGDLLAVKDGDLEGMLSIALDIQYGLEQEMRLLIEEDLRTEEEIQFTPGLLTWSSLALHELIPNLHLAKEPVQVS